MATREPIVLGTLRLLEDEMRSCLRELEADPLDPAARGRLLAVVLRYAMHARPRLFVADLTE